MEKQGHPRVSVVTGSFPPMRCGVGDYTRNLVAELARWIDVEVVTARSFSQNASLQVPHQAEVDSWRTRDMVRFVRTLAERAPDLVHIQYPTQGYGRHWGPYWLPLLLRSRDIPVVQTWHEPPFRLRSFPAAIPRDTLIVVDDNLSESAYRHYRPLIRRKRTSYIPIGSSIRRAILTDVERQALRSHLAQGRERLLIHFGFVTPGKGLEDLFALLRPRRDRLILASELNPADTYHATLLEQIRCLPDPSSVQLRGYVEKPQEIARLLAAADACVLPFRNGASLRNSSFLAAQLQGTFVLTTHRSMQGYDEMHNVFYAIPGELASLREGLTYAGRHANEVIPLSVPWEDVARRHLEVYNRVLAGHHAHRH